MKHLCAFVSIALGTFVFYSSSSEADWRVDHCINKNSEVKSESEIVTRARAVLKKTSESIGLAGAKIEILACEHAEKAVSYYSDGTDNKRPGRYIIFNPTWLQEVAGNDPLQSTAIFAHELGHFLNDDFGARRDLPSKEKESSADRFAGCAIARVGGDWKSLEDLLSRLRANRSQLYPDRLGSLEAAKQGFNACGTSNADSKELLVTLVPASTLPFDGFTFKTAVALPETLDPGPIFPLGGKARLSIQARDPDVISEIQKISIKVKRIKNMDKRFFDYSADPTKQPGFGGAVPRRFRVAISNDFGLESYYTGESGSPKKVSATNILQGTDIELLRIDRVAGLQETIDFTLSAKTPGFYEVRFVVISVTGAKEYVSELGPVYVSRR